MGYPRITKPPYYENYQDLSLKFDCVIMCGGLGSRLREVTSDTVPKALIKVGHQPLISYSVDLLSPSFVNRLIFAVGHLADQVVSWVKSANLPYDVYFSTQPEAGYVSAVRSAMKLSGRDSVVFIHADEIRPGLSLTDAIKSHLSLRLPGTVVATLADQLHLRWLVGFNESRTRVAKLVIRPAIYRRAPSVRGYALAGALILQQEAVSFLDSSISADYLGVVEPLIRAGKLGVRCAATASLFNVGTPEELADASAYVARYRP